MKHGYRVKSKSQILLKGHSKLFSGVVFDMDGLLLDTERMFMRAYQQAASEFGVNFDKKVYHSMIGHRADKSHAILKRALGTDAPIKEILDNAQQHYYRKIEEEGIPVKNNAREILEFLKEQIIPVALATSTFYELACQKLELVALREYFVEIISGDRVEHGKPNPEIYLAACKAINQAPKDCIALEDSSTGLKSAHSAGLTTIMIPDIKPIEANMEDFVDMHFRSLGECLKVMSGST